MGRKKSRSEKSKVNGAGFPCCGTLPRAVALALVASGAYALAMAPAMAQAPETSAVALRRPRAVKQAVQSSNASDVQAKKPQRKKKSQPKIQSLKAVTVSAASLLGNVNLQMPALEVGLSPQLLSVRNHTNVAEALRALPYFADGFNASVSAGEQASLGGNSQVDLRGLGVNHTLVLLNRRRFLGGQNLNSIPSILIKRVQVVTGGASAQWGSGAVAGVVNLVTKKHLHGVTMRVSRGISSAHDGQMTKVGIAAGTAYSNGRGHITFGMGYTQRQPVGPAKTVRDGIARSQLVALPNGTFKLMRDTGTANAAVGGLITSGVLNGFGFNPDGTLRDIPDRTVVAPGIAVGSGAPNLWDIAPVDPPLHNYAILLHTDFRINSSLTLFLQAQHNSMWLRYPWFEPTVSGIQIHADNAFLNPNIRRILNQHGEAGFTLGTAYVHSINNREIAIRRGNTQLVLGLKGQLPDDWHWSAYASYSMHRNRSTIPGWALSPQFEQALDAVKSPLTGNPVCRVALTDPTTNCAPLDLFGVGAASQAAIDYATGTAGERIVGGLGVVSFQLQGSPLELPAGPVSLAIGANYRYRRLNQGVNKLSQEKAFRLLNFSSTRGHFNVEEAFGETFVPILADAGPVKHLNADLAARYSHYSTSGSVWSWKGGLINTFNGGLSLRADYSQDIRAPGIAELDAGEGTAFFDIADPVTHKTLLINTLEGGNPALTPEESHTLTAGVTWTPQGSPGFDVSTDYYHIDIKNIITTLEAQLIVNGCFNGNANLCKFVKRDSSNTITEIIANQSNIGRFKEDGIDVQLRYQVPMTFAGVSGTLRSRVLGTWVHKLQTSNGITTTQFVGSMSTLHGIPRWKAIGMIGFYSQKFSVHGRVRFISSGDYERGLNIVNNHIGNYFYFSAGAKYSLGSAHHVGIYFNVKNIFDKTMPLGIFNAESPWYNIMGRYYTLGIQVHY